MTTLTFKKTERQKIATRMMSQKIFTLLFGGSRSGKTFIIVRSIIVRACKVKSRHLIARYRFNSVKTSIGMDTIPKVMALCFPNLSYRINKTDWFIELPNGSEIWLAGTDDKERTEKILGTEYSTIYFNESSQFNDYDTISLLLTRLAENTKLINRVFYDCNPPSKNHWSYRLFVKGLNPKSKEPINNPSKYGHFLMNPTDNLDNLPAEYIEMLEGLPSRQRDRFLAGKFLIDVIGALWDQKMIDGAKAKPPPWTKIRTVIAVDPATTDNETSDLWGIGAASAYKDNDFSIDGDYSIRTSPQKAITMVINAYEKHQADAIVVETNQGGLMIEALLRNAGYNGKIINIHASKSKFARAEPIAALYEQGRVAHCVGLDDLENEIMEYVPMTSKSSPNRLDWMVWGLTELSKKQLQAGGF